MRLAIDARYPRETFPGIGRHLENLLRELPGVAGEGDEVLVLAPGAPALRPRSLAEQLRLPARVASARPDALLAPYPFTALRCPCPRALLVYDTIALHPRHGLRSAWRRALAGAWLRAAARRSAILLTLSEAARAALLAVLPRRSADVVVTGSAPGPAFTPRPPSARAEARLAAGLGPAYFLHLGTDRPHKNVVGLVMAFAHSELAARGIELALAGPSQLPRPGDPPWLRRLGLVPEERLPALLSGALGLVLPSFDEGLGLPALEAMACGTPVLAACRGALPEVLGPAGLLFDPLDERELATALARVAREPGLRSGLAARGLARSAQYTWPDVAARTLAACRRAAAEAPDRAGRRAA